MKNNPAMLFYWSVGYIPIGKEKKRFSLRRVVQGPLGMASIHPTCYTSTKRTEKNYGQVLQQFKQNKYSSVKKRANIILRALT